MAGGSAGPARRPPRSTPAAAMVVAAIVVAATGAPAAAGAQPSGVSARRRRRRTGGGRRPGRGSSCFRCEAASRPPPEADRRSRSSPGRTVCSSSAGCRPDSTPPPPHGATGAATSTASASGAAGRSPSASPSAPAGGPRRGFVAGSDGGDLEGLFAAGVAAGRDGDHAGAIAWFTLARRSLPELSGVPVQRGRRPSRARRLGGGGERAFREALAVQPDYAAAYYGLADVPCAVGAGRRAAAAARAEAARLIPGRRRGGAGATPRRPVARGVARFRAGRLDEAQQHFEAAVGHSDRHAPGVLLARRHARRARPPGAGRRRTAPGRKPRRHRRARGRRAVPPRRPGATEH